MTRNKKILDMCNLKGLGLEIGPSHSPVLPKSKGYNIEILDHLDKEGLVQKYTGHNVNLESIEEVDYVWNGGSYVETINQSERFDFIIASHIIEHTTCIIRFLNDCMTLLKPNGVLSLAIPDKRFIFDFYRPLSTVNEAINCFLHDDKRHNLGILCEYFLNVVSSGSDLSWSGRSPNDLTLIHDLDYVKANISKHKDSDEYIDAHHWVFTKSSFELLVYDLICLDFLKNLTIVKSFDVEGHEFFVTIRKTDELNSGDVYVKNRRMQMLLNIELELSNVKKLY